MKTNAALCCLAALPAFGVATHRSQAATVVNNIKFLETPPPRASHEQLESNTHAFFWAERSNITLAEDLHVDVLSERLAPGEHSFHRTRDLADSRAVLTAGHTVSSFLLHADKQGANRIFSGTLTFDGPILALIIENRSLNDSDAALGSEDTTYAHPSGGSARGIELGNETETWFTLSEDRRTLTFRLMVKHNRDQIRIVTGPGTQLATAPTPLAAGAGLIGLGALAWHRRKRV